MNTALDIMKARSTRSTQRQKGLASMSNQTLTAKLSELNAKRQKQRTQVEERGNGINERLEQERKEEEEMEEMEMSAQDEDDALGDLDANYLGEEHRHKPEGNSRGKRAIEDDSDEERLEQEEQASVEKQIADLKKKLEQQKLKKKKKLEQRSPASMAEVIAIDMDEEDMLQLSGMLKKYPQMADMVNRGRNAIQQRVVAGKAGQYQSVEDDGLDDSEVYISGQPPPHMRRVSVYVWTDWDTDAPSVKKKLEPWKSVINTALLRFIGGQHDENTWIHATNHVWMELSAAEPETFPPAEDSKLSFQRLVKGVCLLTIS